MDRADYDAVVFGGGFFGCRLALELRAYVDRVLLLEKAPDLLQRASYVNQARVHNGYHYPRSILTGLRSRISFPKFVAEYLECIYSDFTQCYAVGRKFSKVTAHQFRMFCKRIGAPLEPASKPIRKLFNPSLIEDVFLVCEYAFDSVKLKRRMVHDLAAAGVEIRLGTRAARLRSWPGGRIDVTVESGGESCTIISSYVFNSTYSSINEVLQSSGLPPIPLKLELVEMPLVEVPEPLRSYGFTVMCGPFLSVGPFPSRGLHTLHHVRYTPHCFWQDAGDLGADAAEAAAAPGAGRRTKFPQMIQDAARYIPALRDCRQGGSRWELKTLLPQSEVNDSRPVLFRRDHGLPNLTCILGGKIDNVYEMAEELRFLNPCR